MRVLSIVYQRDAGPGVFADAVRARGAELDLWHRAETDEPPADPFGYDAVMTFGGTMQVDQEEEHPWLAEEKALLRALLDRDVPVLGVCLGAQLLSAAAGGEPRRASEPEVGWFDVEITDEGAADPVIGALAPRFEGFGWHSYECGLPGHATVLARTPICAQAYRVGDSAWGIQFHAEVAAADIEKWIDEYDTDPAAVQMGVDPDALRNETRPRLSKWNELGRGLCDRFLTTVAARQGVHELPPK